MAISDTSAPTYTQQVNQNVFVEPLGGPRSIEASLERFSDALYDKSPDTHFMRFMYSLLGPAGVGWLKKNYLEAKLALYAQGFKSFDIESYYGDPFRFGRILLEELPDDPEGLLTREQWDVIKNRDETYRNRAITFFNAARAGGTPLGIELAAQSGLNHAAIVVENYKALFDAHSDEPLGLPRYGQTESTEEFIVIPRQDTSRSEQQVISFADVTAVSGSFQLEFNGQRTGLLPYTANRFEVETALQKLGNIGADGISVTGGPIPNPFIITFTGPLSDQDVPTIQVIGSLIDNIGDPIAISIRVLVGGVESVDETVILSDEYQHNAQTAIDLLRPLNSLPTTAAGDATRTRQSFSSVHASSSYVEVIKYVTGSDSVVWPEEDSLNWIEAGKEKEARRIQGDLQAHYISSHSISTVIGYTDEALKDPNYFTDIRQLEARYLSEHRGEYDPRATRRFPFLRRQGDTAFVANQAKPPTAIPMEVTTQDDASGALLLEGTTNIDAIATDGSGRIALQSPKWWSSLERKAPATDYLEIDLGSARVVNWISFDITRKPLFINLDYDHLDSLTVDEKLAREWTPITLWPLGGGDITYWEGIPYITSVTYNSELPPWQQVKIFFHDEQQHNLTTRFLRLTFARPEPGEIEESPFRDPLTQELIPYSVDVRNLRVGRYANPNRTWKS